jgi:hypothetical protein
LALDYLHFSLTESQQLKTRLQLTAQKSRLELFSQSFSQFFYLIEAQAGLAMMAGLSRYSPFTTKNITAVLYENSSIKKGLPRYS